MAKQTWNNPIDKTVDWGGDATTGNLPVSGEMVQRFIKESLNGKAGLFHYDATNNRYLVFADADARDEYLLDPTQTKLIIGTFDAPFNYTAEINLTSAAYNAVFLGSTGNYIDFTFDIKNKQGASTGENVTVTYTFIRNAVRQTVTETRKFGDSVHFNIDKYIGEGTNTIVVGVTGQTSLAATTVAITYQVVNLKIEDSFDISKAYNLSGSPQLVEVPFTVSGYGTKVVEWYLDGEMLPFVKAEDEVVDVIATRTKNITLANLQQGTHSLQIRAHSIVNGEKFYTDTLYRDIIVYTGANSNIIIGVAVTIPRQYGILGANDNVAIYDMVQYIPYTLRFATYSPSNAANTEVTIKLDGIAKGTVNSSNGIENEFILTSTSSGNKVLNLSASGISKDITTIVQKTDMNLQEITSGLVLNFVASGKTNNSPYRDTWSDGTYTGTLAGFNWNNTSGWVGGRLEMNAGASFAINLAPLDGSPTNTGKTIEIEWSTKNVTNDNAVICDLRGKDGVGILITATKVSMTSADGVVVETEYKSDENVRIGFVINKATGSTNKRMSFIYANGIISRAEQWSETDSYASDKTILFTASEEAEVSLKSILIYDAALTSDNMLNNYTLYRDTIAEMMAVYDRNDVYEEGTVTFSPEKMMNRLPVMIVTGDIPTLENTSDKDTQIVVDIDYYNGDLSFTMKNAAMRPQGTSSMGYPKKNFRIYTQKLENTVLYDADGKVVEDKLYSFKKGAQPVNCWCLKADYAESSGTHNTGIARLWNEALFNAMVTIDLGKNNAHNIDNKPILRTEAQKAAILAKYPYDVRTTIDGFPILLFYRPSVNDDLIFIGKYNFNNDKSTESVFGFKGIPNFDNSKMQCWEVLNNGNAIALFTTVDGFDENWSKAFESRYPDTKTPYTGDLKAFCQWMVNVSQKDFRTEKWEHLNVYMMAAYWCYLMRHAAADQFVKNAMFTSEDGQHFYYILYDNDTINGLINTGHLRIKPTDDRNTVDESGSHVFAGYDSRLWNMLENDEEFITIVSAVDNALYSAGISYANTIKIFDEEQANKWVERVYNQDAQYKYIGPYVEKGIDNLFMLQGKRDLHRRWWLAKRFSIYDAKYVSGTYKSQAVEVKCLNGTEAGQEFSIVAGYPLDYGYGINNVPREFGVSLNVGDRKKFTTKEALDLGDPVRIYGAPNIAGLDFSKMSDRLTVVTIANVYDENLGTKLTNLVIGNASKANYEVSEISGLKQASALEYLDVQGMTKINSLDLSNHKYFKTLKAFGSGISSATFAKGAPVERLELPSVMRALNLNQLPYLASGNIAFEDIANLSIINVTACPNVSNDFAFVYNWYYSKTTANKSCSLVMDNVMWENVDSTEFLALCRLKLDGGVFQLKGRISIPNASIAVVRTIKSIFGETAFLPTAELYIEVPTILELSTEIDSILEGESVQFHYELYPTMAGTVSYSIVKGRQGCRIDSSGLLTTVESSEDTSDVIVRASFVSADGKTNIYDEHSVEVVKRTYPSSVSISGDSDPRQNPVYTWSIPNTPVTGEYVAEWTVEGAASSYLEIGDVDGNSCTLSFKSSIPLTTSGTIKISLKKAYNGDVVASASLNLYMAVIFPSNATILGSANPMEAPNTYTWSTTTSGVNGDMIAEWSLSSEFDGYISIKSQDVEKCIVKVDSAPTELISGTITLILKRSYDGVILVTATKELQALMEGVIITSTTNAPIQAALYAAGLVANESYTLQEEAEAITAEQLQPGTNYNTGIFYSQRRNITHFEEFKYFTALTSVPTYLFYSCDSMRVIELPESITSIGSYAFVLCGSMRDFICLGSITSVERNAFDACYSLTDIDLSNVTGIGMEAFRGCRSLVDIVSISSAINIANSAFSGCSSLTTELIFNEQCKDLNVLTFSGCISLTKVNVMNALVEISSGGTSFHRCYNAYFEAGENSPYHTAIDGILYDKSGKLIYCGGRASSIPSFVTGLETSCFEDSPYITSVNLPNMTFLSNSYVFKNCINLLEASFENIISLPAYVFSGCTSLKTANFPSVKTLSVGCFNDCKSLETLQLSTITSLGEYVFQNCSSLKTAPSLSIPYIPRYAFYGCSSLTSIDLSNISGVLSDYCFYQCSSLETVGDASSVTGVLSHAFYKCAKLKTINLALCNTIGDSAFEGCESLSSVGDLSNVKTIKNYAFSKCVSLNNLIFSSRKTPPIINSGYTQVFGSTTKSYTGRNTYSSGANKLIVPLDASGYDTGLWLDPLCNSNKCGFTLKYSYEPTECTSLTIAADDASGRATNTTIHWTAITNGIDGLTGDTLTGIEVSGKATSEEFPQNTSYTDTVERTISYTYLGVTATTTITQGVWVDAGYTIDLNSQWQESTTIANPDSATYDGVYESFSNKGEDNTAAIMYIDILGYETFKFYVRSYAESSYDYVVVSNLDATLTNSTISGTAVKLTTSGKQTSGTAISNYQLVEFTGIGGGEHRISVMYRKDSSSASGDDRGYVLIPKEQ